jgi:DNA end-binding protein Ku
MKMKSLWKGSIAFGLVNIPIKLYSAIEQKPLRTRLLHRDKLSPIRYKKWCDACTEEVSSDEIVRGIEVAPDKYVVISEDELRSIRPEKSTWIEIVEFIHSHQIDPIFFNAHYYVGPERPKDKTYFLFRDVLRQTGKTAIGKFVMREKEHVCAIEAYREALLLTTLNYDYEIRDIKRVDGLAEEPSISQAEMDLARQLLGQITVDEFDITQFHDTFEDELQQLVAKKARGETISVEKTEYHATPEENLIEALKASLK